MTGAETYTLQNVAGFASSFVSELVNFFIMAFVLFLLLKGMNKLVALGKKPEAPAAPTAKVCPFCQSEIAINATRCRTAPQSSQNQRPQRLWLHNNLAVHAPAHPFRMPGAFSVI